MIEFKKFNKLMTLQVKITTEYKIRRKIAILLLRLAAWVLDANVEVIVEPLPDSNSYGKRG